MTTPNEEREDPADAQPYTLHARDVIGDRVGVALQVADRAGRAVTVHVSDFYAGGLQWARWRVKSIQLPQWLAAIIVEWCDMDPAPAMGLPEWIAAMTQIEIDLEPDGFWRMLGSVDAKADALAQVKHDFGF